MSPDPSPRIWTAAELDALDNRELTRKVAARERRLLARRIARESRAAAGLPEVSGRAWA